MDQFPGERVLKKFADSTVGCGVTRDTASSRARKAEICGRVGSGNRYSVIRGPQNSCLDKCKYSRSVLLRIGKDKAGSSSQSNIIPVPTDSLVKPRKTLASHLTSDSSDTSSVLDEQELPIALPPGEIQRGPNAERSGDDVGEIASDVVGASLGVQNLRNNETGYSGVPSDSRITPSGGSTEARILSHAKRANESRDILKNSRTNLATSNRSLHECSSNSTFDKRKGLLKKTVTSGEASTSNGGKRFGKQPLDGRTAHDFEQGVKILESRRRASCTTVDRDAAMSSVRNRRRNGCAGPRHSVQSNSTVPQSMSLRTMRRSEILEEMTSSLCHSIETSSGLLGAYSLPGRSREGLRSTLQSDISELSFPCDLLNGVGFPEYRMEGIAEVLLALERIEQDDELTYEQVIALETNLFLNGMNLYDQHRDMRLDIDNMSYEELLALEERMGTVSTALTEEELARFLKIDVYHHHSQLSEGAAHHDGQKDDLKCSICQEEYASGDEVGGLPCKHQFHVACAQQWLRIKNWCPVCKGSAAASSASSLVPSR